MSFTRARMPKLKEVLRRRAAHNGLELSCPAARPALHPLYGSSAGSTGSNFRHASRVSCSELLGVLRNDQLDNIVAGMEALDFFGFRSENVRAPA